MRKIKAQSGTDIPYEKYLSQQFPSNKNDYKTVFQNIGNSSHINPAFLYANSMGEGLVLGAQDNGWQNTQQFDEGVKNNPELAKFHYDGARMLGLDNIGKTIPDLISKGYLPNDFSSRVLPYDFVTQKNEKTQSAGFKTPYDAVQAQAAYLNMNRDDVRGYAKSKGYNLTPEQEDFFTSSEYNGGKSNMQSMMDSYNKRGYLKDNNFIFDKDFKIPSDAYPQIYNNVASRIRNTQQLSSKLSPTEIAKMKQGGNINAQTFARDIFNGKSYTKLKAQAGVNMPQNPYTQGNAPYQGGAYWDPSGQLLNQKVSLNPSFYQPQQPVQLPKLTSNDTTQISSINSVSSPTLASSISDIQPLSLDTKAISNAGVLPKDGANFFDKLTSQGAASLGGAATAMGAAIGHGGTKVGNMMGAVAPALAAIPGWGTAASLGLGVAGGIVNAVFGKRPEMYKQEYKDTRTSTYNPYSRGISGSSALMEAGGTIPKNSKNKQSFKAQDGLDISVSQVQDMYTPINNTGYLSGSDTEQNPYNIIPSNQITMRGVNYPVMAYPDGDDPVLMQPDEDYTFPNSSKVTEIPQAQNGTTIYKAGDKIDLTPQQIKQLSAQGYEFSI